MKDYYPEEITFCYWGNPILRKESSKIEDPESEELEEFIEKMKIALKEHNGLGLAGNQVNLDKRLALVTFPKEGEFSEIKALINPEILELSEETEIEEEGCLSFPKLYLKVQRPYRIKAKAYIHGEGETIIEAEGLLAREICHEVDHLDGIVFIDRISQMKRSLIKKDLREIAKKYSNVK